MDNKRGHQTDRQRKQTGTHEPSSSSRYKSSRQHRSGNREATTEQLPAVSSTPRPAAYDASSTYTSRSEYNPYPSSGQNYAESSGHDGIDAVTGKFEKTGISSPAYSTPYSDGIEYIESSQPLQPPQIAQPSEPNYETIQRPARFFKVGCVFKAPWTEAAGIVSDDDGFVETTTKGEKIYTKARRFVVVVEKPGSSICLPLNTHNHTGFAKGTTRARDFAVVYAVGLENSVTAEQRNMVKKPIAIVVDAVNEKIDARSYIDFGSPQTVTHTTTRRALKIGRVSDDCLQRLWNYFQDSIGYKSQVSSSSKNPSSHSTASKLSKPSTHYSTPSDQLSPVSSTYAGNYSAASEMPQNQDYASTINHQSGWPTQTRSYSDTGGAYAFSQDPNSNTDMSYERSYYQQPSTTGYNQSSAAGTYDESTGFTQSVGNRTYPPDDTHITTDIPYVPDESSTVEPVGVQYQYLPTDNRDYYKYADQTATNDNGTVQYVAPTKSTNSVGTYGTTPRSPNTYQQHNGNNGAGRSHSGQDETYHVRSSKGHQSSRHGSRKSRP